MTSKSCIKYDCAKKEGNVVHWQHLKNPKFDLCFLGNENNLLVNRYLNI